jgi:hypothetical protein
MNLTALSAPAFWLGALALAGVLFALQRLRVRHREVLVVTTMFWREALEETRARTLVERFRHPLVYAFLLLLALTAWLGVAAPRANRDDGARHVLLLDLSSPMAAGQRFDDSVRALVAEVARVERDQRTVVACGEHLVTVLVPGEDEVLLAERLALLAPAAAAPSVERALLAFARSRDGERPVRAQVFGTAPVRAEVLARLGPATTVERVAPSDAAPAPRAPAITGLAAARSPLARGRVDVWIEVDGALDASRVRAERVRGNEREALVATRSERSESGRLRIVHAGVLADGAVVAVRLDDPAAVATQARAELVLPDLTPLRVAVGSGLPGPLALVLTSHPDLEIVETGPEVVVCLAGDALAAAAPALLVTESADGPAFELVHTGADDARGLLFEALGDLGLEWVDAGALADATGRRIEFGESTAARRGFALWRELVVDESPFAADSAFPAFVARALEWLAGRPEPRFAPRVGETLAGVQAPFRRAGDGLVLDPVGDDFVPTRAGLYERAGDPPSPALGAPPTLVSAGPARTLGLDALAAPRAARSAPSSAFDLTNLVLLALAALFVTEWVLVRRERIS